MGKKLNLTITAAVLVAMAVIFVCAYASESKVEGADTTQDITATEGDNVVLSIEGAGTLKWYTGTIGSGALIDGATANTYTVQNITSSNTRYYVEVYADTEVSARKQFNITVSTLTVGMKCDGIAVVGSTAKVLKNEGSTFFGTTNGNNSPSFSWKKGTETETGQTKSFIFTADGTLKLTITNGTSTKFIEVDILAMDGIEITCNDVFKIYSGQIITLTPEVEPKLDYTYKWTFKNNLTSLSSSKEYQTSSQLITKDYTFTVTKGNTTATKEIKVKVVLFEVTLTANPATYVVGQEVVMTAALAEASNVPVTVLYKWDDGTPGSNSTKTVNASARVHKVSASVETTSLSATASITLNPSALAVLIFEGSNTSASTSKAVVGGDSITLRASIPGQNLTNYTISWARNPTNTGWPKSIDTVTDTPTANTTYTLTVQKTNNNAITATSSFNATFTPLTVSIVPSKTTIGVNEAFTLTATVNKDTATVAWYTVSGTTETQITGQTTKVCSISNQTQETKYKAKVTNGTVTATSNEVTVAVTGAPTLTITGVTEIDKGATTTLTANYSGTGTVTYSWNNSGGSNKSITTAALTENTDFEVTVTDATLGGYTIKKSVRVTVYDALTVEDSANHASVQGKLAKGVTVTVTSNAVVPETSQATAEIQKATADERFIGAFKFTFGGTTATPAKGPLKLTLPATGCANGDKVYILHCKDDNTFKRIDGEVKDGFVSFDVESFSVFVLCKAIPPSGGDMTMIVVAIVIIIVLAVVAVLFLRKKGIIHF